MAARLRAGVLWITMESEFSAASRPVFRRWAVCAKFLRKITEDDKKKYGRKQP